MRPFRDDAPTPEQVRRALQQAMHAAFEENSVAFTDRARWEERALAYVPCPPFFEPLARRAWKQARDRVVAEAPRIETGTVVACPLWASSAEDEEDAPWELEWALIGPLASTVSLAAASEPPPLAIIAEARVSLAWVRSLVLSRSYAPGIPTVERFEPFAVVSHPIVRVDEVIRVRQVALSAAPDRAVGPWAADAEMAFDPAVLSAEELVQLEAVIRRIRG
jgi:hypothetical protein